MEMSLHSMEVVNRLVKRYIIIFLFLFRKTKNVFFYGLLGIGFYVPRAGFDFFFIYFIFFYFFIYFYHQQEFHIFKVPWIKVVKWIKLKKNKKRKKVYKKNSFRWFFLRVIVVRFLHPSHWRTLQINHGGGAPHRVRSPLHIKLYFNLRNHEGMIIEMKYLLRKKNKKKDS